MSRDNGRAVPVSDAELMDRYGITRTPADYFHYGLFRYTNLADAVAQAERDRVRSKSRDKTLSQKIVVEYRL